MRRSTIAWCGEYSKASCPICIDRSKCCLQEIRQVDSACCSPCFRDEEIWTLAQMVWKINLSRISVMVITSWAFITLLSFAWISRHGIPTKKVILPTLLAGAFLFGFGIVLAFVTGYRLVDVLTLQVMDWMTGFTIGVGYICFLVAVIGLTAIPFPSLRRIAMRQRGEREHLGSE